MPDPTPSFFPLHSAILDNLFYIIDWTHIGERDIKIKVPDPSFCSAILDNLFYIICDEGEGVLIPAPYYPAFDNDLTVGGWVGWGVGGWVASCVELGRAHPAPQCPAFDNDLTVGVEGEEGLQLCGSGVLIPHPLYPSFHNDPRVSRWVGEQSFRWEG